MVPPTFLGYVHVGKLIYITQEGEVLINPSHESTVDDAEVQRLVKSDPYAGVKQTQDTDAGPEQHPDNADGSEEMRKRDEKYEKTLKLIPTSLKDHMPDFYLRPLVNLFEKEQSGDCYLK